MGLLIDVLNQSHHVETCITGNPEIDLYLQTMALGEQEQGLATVHLAVDPDHNIVGFFTLSPLTLKLGALAALLPDIGAVRYPQVGGFLLGRMGVHRARQGEHIGSALVGRAKDIAQAQRTQVGGVFLAVDPKDEGLCNFYWKFGFRRLDPTGVRLRMIVPLG